MSLHGVLWQRLCVKWIMTFKSVVINLSCVFFSGLPAACQPLMDSVNHRLITAYRPKTRSSYTFQFKTLLLFCNFIGVDVRVIQVEHLLLFVEFELRNDLSHAAFLNYVSAIRSKFSFYGWPMEPLHHVKLKLMLKSISVNVRQLHKVKGIFDLTLLSNIVSACDTLTHSSV